jgi:hypothetical protein
LYGNDDEVLRVLAQPAPEVSDEVHPRSSYVARREKRTDVAVETVHAHANQIRGGLALDGERLRRRTLLVVVHAANVGPVAGGVQQLQAGLGAPSARLSSRCPTTHRKPCTEAKKRRRVECLAFPAVVTV